MSYDKIFEKTMLGSLEVKNHIAMASMGTHYSEGDSDCGLGEWSRSFYEERAKGGVGLIFAPHMKAENQIDAYPAQAGVAVLDSDDRIEDLKALSDSVHRYGAKIIGQLSAGQGRNADSFLEDRPPVSASEISLAMNPNGKTKALTVEQINGLVKAYGKAALRMKQGGFDGIMIHAITQMFDQFFTELWNHRTDEYGGSLENRLRFFAECYEETRRLVGDDYPLFVGLSIEHGLEGGRTIEGTIELAKVLEERFNIAGFYIGDGSYDDIGMQNAHNPEMYSSNKCLQLAKEVKTPLVVCGKYSHPDHVLKAIEDGIVMPALARELIAEPTWANKVQDNKIEELRFCLRCMKCMDRVILSGQALGCAINPEIGREKDGGVSLADTKKKVLVVGGGPAGMQAALTADLRGHKVTLVEKQSELGGRLIEATKPDYKYRIGDFKDWLVREIKKSNVVVELNTAADEAYIEEVNPDVVVLARGGNAIVPPVKGSELGVVSEEIFRGQVAPGEKVAVIGGGLVGSEVAYHMAKQGKAVTMIEMAPEILRDDSIMNKFSLMRELGELKVAVHVNTKLEEITQDGVIVSNEADERQKIEVDQVVFAVGFRSDDELKQRLETKVQEVYAIGDDGTKIGQIYDATGDGYVVAKSI